MLRVNTEIHLSNRKIKSILHNPEKSAEAVNLVYVHDSEPGINRFKKRDRFIYKAGEKTLEDQKVLERINKLVIPPAWENVWICASDNGHLQATGIDSKRRKQYRYHELWNSLRNHTKFYRLHTFGRSIPAIRQALENDLSLPGLPQEKVLALVVSLMERTSIRIGNNFYEKLYGSFGLTTLKDRHVKIKGDKLQFIFKGKKGVSHHISLKNKKLAALVQKCQDIPGKELFQYYDDAGNRHSIDSGMVNNYIKSISGQDFSAKDFRTWAGTVHALTAFREIGPAENESRLKKNIIEVLDSVAKHLGNSRTVCKKYYVHPALISLYENENLNNYFFDFSEKEQKIAQEAEVKTVLRDTESGLANEEKLLVTILEKEGLILR